ncbi:MAG: class II fumarate hydratase, partial [Acidobacteriota bacterium]|jgi:fumarate hydratase class II
MSGYRNESDSMGTMQVPADAYYGAQTQRAVENFPISGLRFTRRFIEALGLIKRAAAETNRELGLLEDRLAEAIIQAASEVMEGKHDDQFVIDIFQTGSGTSTNMNANEVIANRAIEILGGVMGSKDPVHPNDHVNRGQSSNDVIPTAIHVSAIRALHEDLLPGLRRLEKALAAKAKDFDGIVKIGRTHLQDATPVRLGQEFSGYAAMVTHDIRRAQAAGAALEELALGGTAVGTGLNTHPKFPPKTIARIAASLGAPVREAENHFEAQGARDAIVEATGQLRAIAGSLWKIANDIRLLASGPRCGIGELQLPATQPGSSIMPGKVNPVIAESLIMVCVHALGNDTAVALGGMQGNFELNVMLPLVAHNFLESARLMGAAAENFAARCVEGIEPNVKRAEELVEQSLAMCTALAPRIGYDAAAKIAKTAYAEGRTVREVAREQGVLPEDELERVLDPRRQTEPG